MSRNFELLSEAGRMREILEPQVEQPCSAPPSPHVEVVEESFPSTPSLEMSGAIRDEIAKLVQKLFLAPQDPRRVVFAGTESGCGCSWMCARVAEGLASQDRGSVCVVDCNLRSPGLHQQFGTENHHGLSDALTGSGHHSGVCTPVVTQPLASELRLRSRGRADDARLGPDAFTAGRAA